MRVCTECGVSLNKLNKSGFCKKHYHYQFKKAGSCIDCNKPIHIKSKRCNSCVAKQRICSIETRKNLSIARKKRPLYSQETCIKMSNSAKGHVVSQETKDKISKANSNPSLEFRNKMSILKGGKGIKNRNRVYDSNFTGLLRHKIRVRDNKRCRLCGKIEKDNGKKLSIHHIDYDKQNSVEDNLISLCCRCHTLTNTNRILWTKFFNFKSLELMYEMVNYIYAKVGGNMKKDLMEVSSQLIDEILEKSSRVMVGKVLKRIDICPDSDILKKTVKELVYEEFRSIKQLIEMHAKSLNLPQLTRIVEFKKDEHTTA